MNHRRVALTLLLMIAATTALSACADVVRGHGWSAGAPGSQRNPGGRD
jgi:hypothetical protein